jgi:hypothetical protein
MAVETQFSQYRLWFASESRKGVKLPDQASFPLIPLPRLSQIIKTILGFSV